MILNNNMNMKALFLIMSLITLGCSKEMDHESLSLTKKLYQGNQLRTDGYYYQYIDGDIFSIYFFYRDGIVLSVGGSENNFEAVQGYIHNNFVLKQEHKESAIGWGVFIIDGKNIAFERWYPSEQPYPAYVRAGHIVNDTTFTITESYKVNGGQKTNVNFKNETYYFKQCSTKPDSTNSFIK